LGVAAGLGKEQAALQAGQGGGCEPFDVGPRSELARSDHAGEASADAFLPTVEAGGEHGPNVVVAFTELADEVGDGTASPPPALPAWATALDGKS